MAGLTGLFRTIQATDDENDKLVDLFRNRVALKKEFAALREEKYRLQDRIKEHRGSIERGEQKLAQLEALLLDPEWVHNVAVYYQMRRLAADCEARIERFAENLKQQHEERIFKFTHSQWMRDRDRKRAAVQTGLNEQRMAAQAAEDRYVAAQQELESLKGVSRLLWRKKRGKAVAEAEAAVERAQESERILLRELDRIEKLKPPPHQGLDLATKRVVNFLILSFGQQLYLDYYDDGLTQMAKQAQQTSVGAINYGNKRECGEILECLEKRRQEVDGRVESGELLQKRAQLLADRAAFRRDDDAVPIPPSVAGVIEIKANGAVSTIDANLLGENCFGIARYLSN